MASKAKAARTFDVLLPRLNRAEAGVIFTETNYVRRTGSVPAALQAAVLPGGSIGVHAAAADGTSSLCGCSLASQTKDTEARLSDACKAAGKADAALQRVAGSVTCKFCAARLISAGVLTAETLSARMPAAWRAYAADYGSRAAEAELAAVQARKAEALAAAEAAAEAARKAEAAEARKAASEARKAAKAAKAEAAAEAAAAEAGN